MLLHREAIVQVNDDNSYTITSDFEVEGEVVSITADTLKECKKEFKEVLEERGIDQGSYQFSMKMTSQ